MRRRKLLIPMLMSFGMSCSTGNNLSCEISRMIKAGTLIEGRTINERYFTLAESGKEDQP